MEEPNIYDRILTTLMIEGNRHQCCSMSNRNQQETDNSSNALSRNLKPKSILKKHVEVHQSPAAHPAVYSSKHQTLDYTDSLSLPSHHHHQPKPGSYSRHLVNTQLLGDVSRKDFHRNQTNKFDSLKQPLTSKHLGRTGCIKKDFNINGYTVDCLICDDWPQIYPIRQDLHRNNFNRNDPISNNTLKYNSKKFNSSRNGVLRYKPSRKLEIRSYPKQKQHTGKTIIRNNSFSLNSVIKNSSRNDIYDDSSTSSVSTRYGSIIDHSITTQSVSSDGTLYDAFSNLSLSNESQNAQCRRRKFIGSVDHCHSALNSKQTRNRDVIYLSSPPKTKAAEKYSKSPNSRSPIWRDKKTMQQSPLAIHQGGHKSRRSYRTVSFLLVYLAVAVAIYLTNSDSKAESSVTTKSGAGKKENRAGNHFAKLREDFRESVLKTENRKLKDKLKPKDTLKKATKAKVEATDKNPLKNKEGKERPKKKSKKNIKGKRQS